MPGAVEDRAVVDKYAGAVRKVPGMEEMEKLSVISRQSSVSDGADRQDEPGRIPDWPLGNGPRGKEQLGYTPVFLAKSAQTIGKKGDKFRSWQRAAKSEAFLAKSGSERERRIELGRGEGIPHPRGVCMSIKRREMGEEQFG